ncbi:hypothetical protein ABK040_013492 [Willaertia magna]
MERMVFQNEAQNHIQAYLEYRMIVGDRDDGTNLLPEKEYEKLRKEFYKRKEEEGVHFVNTSFLRGKNKRTDVNSLESKYEKAKSMRGNKTKVVKTNVSLFELYNTAPTFSGLSSSFTSGSGSSSISLKKKAITHSSSSLSSNKTSSRSFNLNPTLSTQTQQEEIIENSLSIQDEYSQRLEEITNQLNDTKLSEAKKYALKKQLRMIKAEMNKRTKN